MLVAYSHVMAPACPGLSSPIWKLLAAFFGLFALCLNEHGHWNFWVALTAHALVAMLPWRLARPLSPDRPHTALIITLLHMIPTFVLGAHLLLLGEQLGRWQRFLVVLSLTTGFGRCYDMWVQFTLRFKQTRAFSATSSQTTSDLVFERR